MVNPFLLKLRVMEVFSENQSGTVCIYKDSNFPNLMFVLTFAKDN